MRKRGAASVLALAALVLGGCATPGPLHVYSLVESGERPVADRGAGAAAEVPSFLEPDERVSGFAYDPFTDHFFLRLDPGNRIRVVDRPARAIKREFELEAMPAGSRGDIAVRPRDGHIFLLLPSPGQVLETTRLGKRVRTLELERTGSAPIGLAVDAARDRLLALAADGRRVTIHDPGGKWLDQIVLEAAAGASLAYDAERRELYAPLASRPGEFGVFDERGKLVRTLAADGALVDVGPRSFVRVF